MRSARSPYGPILLLLGGNVGDIRRNGEIVLQHLAVKHDVVRASHWYVSPAWGFNGPDFLNCVVELSVNVEPQTLLEDCLRIESLLGRERKGEGYTDRPMDIDLLYFGDRIVDDPGLQVPHPRIPERRFTLAPLNEYWADWVHPGLQKSQRELLAECGDASTVTRMEE